MPLHVSRRALAALTAAVLCWPALAAAQLPVAAAPASNMGGGTVTEANYRLAARFAPYKMRRLVYSTGVTPRWIKGTERFWYEWETAQGKRFMIVDPVAGTKRPLFDNDRIAAELTRLTKDPWDGRHLPIRAIRFTGVNTLEFEVESSQDAAAASEEEGMALPVRRDHADAHRDPRLAGAGQSSELGERLARRADRRVCAAA
jgi:dipeptidyl-peptidase-4